MIKKRARMFQECGERKKTCNSEKFHSAVVDCRDHEILAMHICAVNLNVCEWKFRFFCNMLLLFRLLLNDEPVHGRRDFELQQLVSRSIVPSHRRRHLVAILVIDHPTASVQRSF